MFSRGVLLSQSYCILAYSNGLSGLYLYINLRFVVVVIPVRIIRSCMWCGGVNTV